MEWIGPPSATSRSISMTLPAPSLTRAVIRDGLPNRKSPMPSTDNPLIWPDLLAVDVDQHDAARDHLMRFLAHPVGAIDALGHGALDMLAQDDRRFGNARPVIGLAHHIGEVAGVERDAFIVVGKPEASSLKRATAAGIGRPQAPVAHHRGDEAGEEA